MKFLFTAPRYHTNQVPIVKGLKERGHEVRYFVVFIGATEDHTHCEPLVLKPSRTTVREKRKLEKTMSAEVVESKIGGHFIPDYAFLKQAFEAYMPDVVICREKTNLTLCVKTLCNDDRIPCILYDQEPLYPLKASEIYAKKAQEHSFLKRIQIKLNRVLNPDLRMLQQMRSTSGFPTVRMTPVKYRRLPKERSEGQSDGNAFFVPFVAEQTAAAANREYCKNGVIHILSVGKFRDYKNLPILVDTAKLLAEKTEFVWQITIIGQAFNKDEVAYYQKLEQTIREAGLEEKIKLKTNLPYYAMSEEYLKSDVFILTSKRETASIAILEAMANGLAVISTDYNGTASYIEDAKCGTTFETENAESLCRAIERTIGTGVMQLGCRAHKVAVEAFSFENYYSALQDMLDVRFGITIDR